MNKSSCPIGIFDSGIGGISIWKEVHALLPYENTIYLGDRKYAPYGNRSPEEIVQLSKKNTEVLMAMNCKLIIVACNTATTNAISDLRKSFDIPFVGIEPAIKPAALSSRTGKIGVLATKGTLSSTLFHETSKTLSEHVNIIEIIGEGLVTLIEKGDLESEELKKLLQKYLQPMVEAKVDHIVLGCTHYPFLTPMIRELIPADIRIIDSGAAVANRAKNILDQMNLLNKSTDFGKNTFYTNLDPEILARFVPSSEHNTVSYLDF